MAAPLAPDATTARVPPPFHDAPIEVCDGCGEKAPIVVRNGPRSARPICPRCARPFLVRTIRLVDAWIAAHEAEHFVCTLGGACRDDPDLHRALCEDRG